MAKNDQEEAFEKMLSSTLSRTIDFVKFAEAKNAALLTFSSAWILASVNIAYGANTISQELKALFSCVIPLFVLSAIISILSFLPRMNLSKFHRDPEQHKSLLYFSDIAAFSTSSYRDRVRERYMPPDDRSITRQYADDLSIQISVNSSIAIRKFTFFKIAATPILIAIAILLIPTFKTIYQTGIALMGSVPTH
jgi:hypothetical protein